MNRVQPYHFYILFTLLFIAFCFVVPDSGYDKYFWISWSKGIAEHGLGAIYSNPEVNNFPLVLYLLKAFTLFFSADAIDVFSINYLKCFAIVFDFVTLAVVVLLLKKHNINLLLCLVLVFNPAFWYNTVIWGQVDSIHTLYVFVSVLLAINKKPLPALIFILLAVNTKVQAVVFLPVLLLIVFNTERTGKPKSYTEVIISLIVLTGIQLIIFLPFIVSGNFGQTIHSLINSSIDFYPTVSRNAYNMWHLFFADPLNTSDRLTFLISLKLWGIVLFVLFYVGVLFLFMKSKKGLTEIFLVFTLLSLGFFFFNTQMHERYVHPVVLFSGLYAIFSKRYYILIISSFAYLLNLEAVMQMFSYFDDEVLGFVVQYKSWFVFNPVFISLLFLSAIVIGIIDLRRNELIVHRP
jgi:Gpi18-like mannosyltransferase